MDAKQRAQELGAKCSTCPLNADGVPCLVGRGPSRASLAIVAERPTTTDVDSDKIMSRPYWLRKAIGGKVNDAWRTPAIACRPSRKVSTKDLEKAAECCRPRVEAEIKATGAKAILAAGKFGFQSAYGRRKNVEEWFGAVGRWPADKQVWLIATFSPPWYYSPNHIPIFMRFAQRAWRFAHGQESRTRVPAMVVEPGPEAIDALKSMLAKPQALGYDLETMGNEPMVSAITAVGLASKEVAVSLPWDAYDTLKWDKVHDLEQYEGGAECRRLIKEILQSAQHTKVMHNVQADYIPMARRGIVVQNWDDTLGYHRTISPDIFHDLQFAVACELPVRPWKALFCSGGDEGAFDTYVKRDPVNELRPYNASDAWHELPLLDALKPQVDVDPLLRKHMDEYLELQPIAIKMKMKGLRISKKVYERHREELKASGDKLRGEFDNLLAEGGDAISQPYELGSAGTSPALKKLFFEDLNCAPVSFNRDTGAVKLDGASLGTFLKEGTPYVQKVSRTTLAFRKVRKLETSFYGYPEWLHQMPDGDLRAYPSSNPLGTQGSRWTMRNPNAQQLTKGTFIGNTRITPNIRECIVPDPGFVLVEADHSQQELRLIAYVMDVDKLLEWFAQGKDVHKMHAAKLLQKDEKDVTKKERDWGKKVFGFNYNKTDDVTKVYENMKGTLPGMTMSYVKSVHQAYMELHPGIPRGQKALIREAKQNNRITCRISGRFRHFYGGRVDENQALNFCMQTGGGAIMNLAIRMLDPHIRWDEGEALLLNVHDALIVQCRLDRVPVIAELLRKCMGTPVDIGKHKGISIPVDWVMGPAWGTHWNWRGLHVELPEIAAVTGQHAHTFLSPTETYRQDKE